MNFNFFFLTLAPLLLVFSQAEAKFLPDDQTLFETYVNQSPNISEAQFNQLVSQAQKKYEGVVKGVGGKLIISGSWKSQKLNAGSTQTFGAWLVQISGALARRPEITADGLTLIICHELGHHLGGYSFTSVGAFTSVWAANEGEADYFASQVCARKMWADELPVNASFKDKASPEIFKQCNLSWTKEEDRNLCYRIATAGEVLGRTMAAIKGEAVPDVTTPDLSEVEKTDNAHPKSQCRTDTYFQAALCTAAFKDNLIPGKKTPEGPFSPQAEREASSTSCMKTSGYSTGLRPACWFKPQL